MNKTKLTTTVDARICMKKKSRTMKLSTNEMKQLNHIKIIFTTIKMKIWLVCCFINLKEYIKVTDNVLQFDSFHSKIQHYDQLNKKPL